MPTVKVPAARAGPAIDAPMPIAAMGVIHAAQSLFIGTPY
jgi:hypothetical protein